MRQSASCFILGVSTLKIKGVAKDIFGVPVSPKRVSKTTAYLEELRYCQERELAEDVELLFPDGITEKAREPGWRGR